MDISQDRILGELPDPFLMKDGTRVKNEKDWRRRRLEILDEVVPLAYGGVPPTPAVLSVDALHLAGAERINSYRVTAGTETAQTSFEMRLYLPSGVGRRPVLLTGDDCFHYCGDEVIREAWKHGFIVAKFNRTSLAADIMSADRSCGLYPVYPSLHFGAIAAWAWGYSRCIDALETLDYVDDGCIAVTGHSRGGKAALLAAASDERIRFTQANCSGAGGCGCFRYEQNEAPESELDDHRNERLEDLMNIVPYWFGEEMRSYVGRENELPFDMHYLKAAVAPRWFLQTDTAEDIWSNPRGTYQTYRAAKEVYDFLGVKNHIAAVYRYGKHYHMLRDFLAFFDFIEAARANRPFLQENAEKFGGDLAPIYHWTRE